MFTAALTIGYGLQAPETQGGHFYLVFFSLLGVPLHASVVVGNGGFASICDLPLPPLITSCQRGLEQREDICGKCLSAA